MVTNLRIARMETGLTLRAFAAMHGFSESVLCRIETGTQYVPPGWRSRLAQALGLSIDEVCDEHGWPRIREKAKGKTEWGTANRGDSNERL